MSTLVRKFGNLRTHWEYGGLYRVVQKAADRALNPFFPALSSVAFVTLKTSIFTGYWAHVRQPRSFSEKIVHSKLFRPHPLAQTVADKFKVRGYVAERVSADILNQLYWHGTEPDEIPFDALPNSFVVKANHGAGLNSFIADLKATSRDAIRAEALRWMNLRYSQHSHSYETQYDDIPHQILVERFMTDKRYGHPLDFKFFCFGGEPKYIQVDIDRFTNHRRNIYTASWNLAPFELHYRNGRVVARPKRLAEMLDIARRLSADFEFCRVDLYLLDNSEIVFGEITLYPGGGYERFFPVQWDFRLGVLWDLDSEAPRIADHVLD